jgi:hypothetical protein
LKSSRQTIAALHDSSDKNLWKCAQQIGRKGLKLKRKQFSHSLPSKEFSNSKDFSVRYRGIY